MSLDETLKMMGQTTYPKKVDVVDTVMAKVADKPYLRATHKNIRWRYVSAAAAVIALVVVNVLFVRGRNDNTDDILATIVQVNDFSMWNYVEDGALNPLEEYLFDE